MDKMGSSAKALAWLLMLETGVSKYQGSCLGVPENRDHSILVPIIDYWVAFLMETAKSHLRRGGLIRV